MREESRQNPRKRPPRLLRWLVMLFAVGAGLLLALAAGFIGYNFSRPVAPPATISLAELARDSAVMSEYDPEAGLSSGDVKTTSSTGTTRSAGPLNGERISSATLELIPIAFQKTEAMKEKARAINQEFVSLMKDFEIYEKERTKRTDPDEPTGREEECFDAYIQHLGRIHEIMGNDESLWKWDVRLRRAMLGRTMKYKDWYFAADICYMSEKDWDGTVYCCRQMGVINGGTKLATMVFAKHFYGRWLEWRYSSPEQPINKQTRPSGTKASGSAPSGS